MELSSVLSGLNPQFYFPKKISYIFSSKYPLWKNFLYFLKRKLFLYFRLWSSAYFIASSKKKIHPEKNSLHFRKLELLALILKYFKERKPWNLEWMELFSFNITQFQEKIIYISGNGNPKRAF